MKVAGSAQGIESVRQGRIYAVAVLALCVAAPAWAQERGAVPAGTVAQSAALDEALRELAASHAAWSGNDADFRRKRADRSLSAAESDAFAAYVADLKRQVIVDCAEAVRLGGERQADAYDCAVVRGGNGETAASAAGTGSIAALPPDPSTARTEGEVAEGVDEAMRRIEGELDELTRTAADAARQSAAAATAGKTAAGGAAGPDGQGGSSGLNRSGGAKEPAWGPAPDESGDKNGAAANGGGDSGDGSAAATGPDAARPDPGAGPGAQEREKTAKTDDRQGRTGDDDDVIAGQLREAAEKEQDPVLREKLWAEYRKYKAAQR